MLSILIIEDNDDHYTLIEDALLEGSSKDLALHHEKELVAGLKALEQHSFDICLCDLQLPDAPMNTTIERLKAFKTTTPIIALTSLNSIEVAKELLKHDVQDYLPKDELSAPLLNRICNYAIERKQQQLVLEKRNADMQTFCASLSHDFKAHIRCLNHTSFFLQKRLEKRIELDPEELKWLNLIQNSTSGIHDLVDGLGQFLLADHEDTQIDKIDLSELFQNLHTTIIDTHEQALEIVIQDDWPNIPGNASQLNIVFNNLIFNSIKYNKNLPHIEIRGKQKPNDNYYEISVRDNGIGIDSKYFTQIFAPFKRLHGAQEYAGTGLGLSIVKCIIDKHHGKIDIESEPGKGSTFIINLPLNALKDRTVTHL